MEKLVHLQLNFPSCIIQKSTSNGLSRGQNLEGHRLHHPKQFDHFWIFIYPKWEVGRNGSSKRLSLNCRYLTWTKWHINTFVSMVIEIALLQFLRQWWCLICCTSWSTVFCAGSSWIWGCGCTGEFDRMCLGDCLGWCVDTQLATAKDMINECWFLTSDWSSGSTSFKMTYINLANVNNRNYAHTCIKLTFFLHHTGCGI